jgi:cell division protein FtsB
MLIAKIKQFYHHNANLENGVLILAFFIAMGFLWNTMGTLQKNFELQQQVDEMRQEIALIEIETELLEYERHYLNSNEYVELSAREHLNRAAPGEKLVMLPLVEPKDEPDTAPIIVPTTQRSNFEQWLYFFFGNGNRG